MLAIVHFDGKESKLLQITDMVARSSSRCSTEGV
jgi:hypothetical protein